MQNLMNIMNNSCLYTDVNIFRNNMNIILGPLPESTRLIPVLKDDAYGLGLERMAAESAHHPRVSCVAVAQVSEGLALRASGFEKDILVMSAALPHQLSASVCAKLTLAAPSADFVCALDKAAAELGLEARVHIKIDTGLHRIGVETGGELAGLIAALDGAEHVAATGVFSHFADPNDENFTRAQFALFKKSITQLENAGYAGLTKHISCSAATELYPEYALDAVRVGRRLYMDSVHGTSGGVEETCSWRAYVTDVKERRAGDCLGYGRALRLERDARIAVLGAGYGDCALLSALCDAGAEVLIRGKRCRLLVCCMDQSLVDVTGLDCKAGDEATIFGSDGAGGSISMQRQAALIGGEGCALTSALSRRVARIYTGD